MGCCNSKEAQGTQQGGPPHATVGGGHDPVVSASLDQFSATQGTTLAEAKRASMSSNADNNTNRKKTKLEEMEAGRAAGDCCCRKCYDKKAHAALEAFCKEKGVSAKATPAVEALTGTTLLPPAGAAGNDALAGKSTFVNWGETVRSDGLQIFTPKDEGGVAKILSEARKQSPPPQIRCRTAGHSWTPVFADSNDWVLDMRSLNTIHWDENKHPTQITIGPGCTSGQLGVFLDSKERGKWRGMGLPGDVVLEDVCYGGIILMGCHGTGKTATVPDYCTATTVMRADGTIKRYSKDSDPATFALAILSFGLLGVHLDFTLQLDDSRTAVEVTDAKPENNTLFLPLGVSPTASNNPLKALYDSVYALEVFWLPGNSLRVTKPFRPFAKQEWDPYKDNLVVKTFKRTGRPVPRDNDGFFGIGAGKSSRFDENFALPDFLKVNLGGAGVALMEKFGDDPSLVAFYADNALKAFDPVGKLSGSKTYDTSLVQAIHWMKYITDGFKVSDVEVCILADDDFTNIYKAWAQCIAITKRTLDEGNVLPLNVAMEFRFTNHSSCPLSPAYGKPGDVFAWIEILSSTGTPSHKPYAKEVAEVWMSSTLKDGTPAARPHWAKFAASSVPNAVDVFRQTYKAPLGQLKALADREDPRGVFRNDFFNSILPK